MHCYMCEKNISLLDLKKNNEDLESFSYLSNKYKMTMEDSERLLKIIGCNHTFEYKRYNPIK